MLRSAKNLQATTETMACNNPNTPSVFCAKHQTGVSCAGDSGGPVVADLDGNGRWVLYGIVSFGSEYCVRDQVVGFEEVSQHANTILSKIQGKNRHPRSGSASKATLVLSLSHC